MVGESLTNNRGAGSPQNQAQENWPEQQVRLSDSDRLEAFSDGVFSITITLLVVEIVRPEHEPGHLLDKLLAPHLHRLPGFVLLRRRDLAQIIIPCSRECGIATGACIGRIF